MLAARLWQKPGSLLSWIPADILHLLVNRNRPLWQSDPQEVAEVQHNVDDDDLGVEDIDVEDNYSDME